MSYTYLVINKITGMFYYGARYSEKSSTDDLWSTYFTSSKLVKREIDKYGKDSFGYEVRKTFDSVEQCLNWEYKVLRRLNAKEREDCYNLTNGGSVFNSSKSMKVRNPMNSQESVKKMVETKRNLRLNGNHRTTAPTEKGRKLLSAKISGDNNPMKNPEIKKRMVDKKRLNNNTTANTKWIYNPSLKIRKRIKEELLKNYLSDGWILGTNLKTERVVN